MKELPTEVLHLIFTQLPLVQKQECMFVCRQWAYVLSTLSLFHTIAIQNEKKFGRFLNFMEQNPSRARQVENLALLDCIDLDFNNRKLLSLFPKLTKLELSSIFALGTSSAGAFNRDGADMTVALGNQHIRSLRDKANFELSRLILNERLCSQLVTLVLDGYHIPETPDHVFHLLDNAPVLTNLVADGFQLSINLLESIHHNAPLLESLELLDVYCMPCELPPRIEPCTTLASFNIKPDYNRTHDFSTNWLEYICTKYTNLKHFKADLRISQIADPDDVPNPLTLWQDAYQIQMPILLNNCSESLQSFTYAHSLDTDHQVLNAINTSRCQFEKMEVVAERNAGVLNDIAELDHFKHIQHLVLTEITANCILTELKNMDALQSLSLTYRPVRDYVVLTPFSPNSQENTIDILALFDRFPPALESIGIKHAAFKYDLHHYSKNVPIHFDQIKQLTLYDVTMDTENMNAFISECLLNLTSLTLSGIFRKFNESFSIPNHRLSYLNIALVIPLLDYYKRNVCLVTNDRRRPRYYTCNKELDKSHSELSNYLLPVSLDDLGRHSFLTFSCASVDKFIFMENDVYIVADEEKCKALTMASNLYIH